MWTNNITKTILAIEGRTGPGSGICRVCDPLAMNRFLDFSLQQVNAMVALVRTPLDKQQRTLLGALLTIDVHARDVTCALVNKSVTSLLDFQWTKQLRYYWDESRDDVNARQTNTSFEYGYEYVGNGARLVITPLTDICYMTLTGALHMKLGGAPAGPAGTGTCFLTLCVYVPICTYVCLYVCMYVCMCVCVCMYVCMCLSVCMYVCMYVCIYVCMYVRTYVCMYVCMCVCVCVSAYLFVCLSIYLNTDPSIHSLIYQYIYLCMYLFMCLRTRSLFMY